MTDLRQTTPSLPFGPALAGGGPRLALVLVLSVWLSSQLVARSLFAVGELPPDPSEITVAPRADFPACQVGQGMVPTPPPRPADAPRWNGMPLSSYTGSCPYDVTYTDGPRSYACTRSFVFIRRYALTNSCTGVVDTTLVQEVRVGDHTAPRILPPPLPPGRTEFSFVADQANCSASVDSRLGTLTIVDACSSNGLELLVYVFPNGDPSQFPLGPYVVNGPSAAQAMTDPLPEGRHLFRYVGNDECGNTSGLDLYVNVTTAQPTFELLGNTNGIATGANCVGGVVLRYRIPSGYTGGTTRIDVDLDVPDPRPAHFEVDRTVDSAFINGDPTGAGVIASIVNLPTGSHSARLTIRNDCNGKIIRYVPLLVRDGQPPTIPCVPSETIDLVQDPNFGGIAKIYATDLLSGPARTCSGPATAYAVYLENSTAAPGFQPQAGRDELDLNCSDVGTAIVRVYAFSSVSGRSNFCNTVLNVRPGAASCANQNGGVSGRILTASGAPIPNVEVTVAGGTSSLSAFTDGAGNYSIAGLTENQPYRVSAFLNSNPINGVTTFDIRLLSRRLQNIDDGLSPYEILAGDANRNGVITIQDVVLVREVVLGINANFDNNTSWRFLDADYVFPDPDDPWLEPIPETIELPALTGTARVDFVGFKVGDLDSSADPN